jgi:hypothetical protein
MVSLDTILTFGASVDGILWPGFPRRKTHYHSPAGEPRSILECGSPLPLLQRAVSPRCYSPGKASPQDERRPGFKPHSKHPSPERATQPGGFAKRTQAILWSRRLEDSFEGMAHAEKRQRPAALQDARALGKPLADFGSDRLACSQVPPVHAIYHVTGIPLRPSSWDTSYRYT